jgi:hypothetical protein
MSDITIPLLGLADGTALIIAALLAHLTGIDPNLGWGKGRIALLIAGFAILAMSAYLLSAQRSKLHFLSATIKSSGLKTFALLAHVWLIVLFIYIWFITYGQWTTWNHTTNYYDRLANSFLAGHLNIDIKPDAALLAAPSPYTPTARPAIQNNIWDMSFYQGKFYLYWGPVPAILITPLKLLIGRKITDNYVVFFAYAALLIFNSLLIMKIWRRFYPGAAAGLTFVFILLIGLVAPILWSLSEPNIYNAAVGAAQAFFVGGIFWAVLAFDQDGPPSGIFLFLAGLFWVCAVGSRALYAITIIFPTLLTIVWIVKRNARPFTANKMLVSLCSLILPLGAGAIALGWYNWARFGSAFEFGLRYQITIWDLNKLYPVLFLPRYIGANLIVYLLQPPRFIPAFPYIQPTMAMDLFQSINSAPPQLYYAGRLTGLLFSAPFLILGLSFMLPRRKIAANGEGWHGDPPLHNFVLYLLLGSFITAFLLLVLFFVGSMRYLVDVISPLSLLVMMAIWQGLDRGFRGKGLPKRVIAIISLVLILISIVIGILLAFSAETDPFQNNNPILFETIRHLFSIFK